MNNLTEKQYALTMAQGFLEKAKEDINSIGQTFFMLGCRLYEARRFNYVETLGYENIEQLAEEELHLGRSTTYNLIQIFERFCDRDKNGNYHTWIKSECKDYSYSQLVEINKIKAICPRLSWYNIPAHTPVRKIAEYVKYVNKNPGDHKDFPKWRDDEFNKSVQSLTNSPLAQQNQLNGQLSVEQIETVPSTNNIETDTVPEEEIKTQTKTVEEIPVQTFGLPTCAEAKKEEKPKYNLSTRDGVRAFLNDYENWESKYLFSHIYYKAHFWKLKKNCIYAVEWKSCDNVAETHFDFSSKVRYFLCLDKADYDTSQPCTFIELSKRQLETYFTLHKDEL